ncbi:GIP, partial [Symbiodinium microadriaticum]
MEVGVCKAYFVNKETSLAARQMLLYLVAHACSKVVDPLGMNITAKTSANKGALKYQEEFDIGNAEFRQAAPSDQASVDVGGPMRIRSKDTHGTGYRFILAAAYTRPKFPDQEDPPEPKEEDMASATYDFSDLDLDELPAEELVQDKEVLFPNNEETGELGSYMDEQMEELGLNEELLSPELKALKAGDKLWDDDERAADEQAANAAEEEPLEGNHEVPVDFLYFVRIHSDRAHEMRSLALRAWTLDSGIWLTRTEGQSPQSNGTAERADRFFKGRARMLLRAAGLGTEHWATAIVAAAHRQREERLRPEDPQVPCPYGTRVAIKKKRYGDGGRHDLLPHWTKGTYMGPVWDVKGGSAVLEDKTNRFTVTTHLRARLHDPGALNEEDPVNVEPLKPARRLRTKATVGADGLVAKRLEVGGAKERRELVKEIVRLMENDPVHKVRRPQLKNEGNLQEGAGYSTVGAYNFGGVYGITKYTREAPELAKKVTQLLQMDFPGEVFSSATIVQNASMPVHKDVYNERCSYNLISPLQVTNGAGVWEELCEGDTYQGKFHLMDVKGHQVPGQVRLLKRPVKVNPRRLHCSIVGREGPRVIVAGHTIGSWRKLTDEMREELMDCRFALPEKEESEGSARVFQSDGEEVNFVVEPEDVIEDYSTKDSEVEVDEDIKRCAKAAVENLYTNNIEKVLKELEGDLKVVHTVHPKEVEENASDWIPSMAREMKTLEDIGAVRRLKGTEAREYLKQPGVTVVPGKSVYTVKPPSEEGQVCRRKTRIVSCGGFQPKNDAESNYSGGAVAEAVRLGIAEAARNRWCACTGDIVSAFLRAPEGTRLVLRPPLALIKAGLAEPEEVWVVQTALSGFRSSPRWWSTHRTMKMKGAVTKGGLVFQQGQTDADVWQIKKAEGTTTGLMIVYVDDFLIMGAKHVCDDAYEWMATTWESTPCQYATPTTSVRFLGMEIVQKLNDDGEVEAYTLAQEGYIEEILRHHGIGPTEKSLLPSSKEWMTLDPQGFPPDYKQDQLKTAQSITGELAWLAQRCRPDLSYTVSIMGSLTTKDPARVATIGRKTLCYLNHTKEWKLEFRTGGAPHLVTYTDSSYSPEGEKSHAGSVVFWAGSPVAWKSGRQSLVTTSSAETELLAASDGATLTYSIDAMLSDVGGYPASRELRVDNSAAITLASEEGGSWRTRHLKVRAASLRQRIQDGWATITHCPGEWQLADGLTKILASKRMDMLMGRWGLGPQGRRERDDPHGLRNPESLSKEERLDLVHLAGAARGELFRRNTARIATKILEDDPGSVYVELGRSYVDHQVLLDAILVNEDLTGYDDTDEGGGKLALLP